MQSIVYISGGALGDLIHQIGIIYEIYVKTGKKGILYISDTARNPHGFTFTIEKTYNDTYKLITDQSYIESYHIHNNEPFDINLSSWIVNQPLYINNWSAIFSAEYNIDWCSNKYLDILFKQFILRHKKSLILKKNKPTNIWIRKIKILNFGKPLKKEIEGHLLNSITFILKIY